MSTWELIVARSYWTYAKCQYENDDSDANFALLDHAARALAQCVGMIVSKARVERQTYQDGE